MQKLPVVLCFDRAGLVGEDGATHMGAFDLAAYRAVPECIIAAPSDEYELKNMMWSALHSQSGPYIIRYPRGLAEGKAWEKEAYMDLETGRGRSLKEGKRVAVLALGPFSYRALEAAGSFGEDVAVYDMRFLKPLDTDLLDSVASRFEAVLTVEDGVLKGGLYGAVCEYFEEKGYKLRLKGLGIPDRFVFHGSQKQQREAFSLDSSGIEAVLRELL